MTGDAPRFQWAPVMTYVRCLRCGRPWYAHSGRHRLGKRPRCPKRDGGIFSVEAS